MVCKIPEKDQLEISEQASQLKGKLLIGQEAPVGNDLPIILQKLDIILLEYPIQRAGSNSFSAVFCRMNMDSREMLFLGVNTWDYYDRQLFAIAHELYHYLNPSQPHISRDGTEGNPAEQRADWFAAEFLLPLQALKKQIVRSFGKTNISESTNLTLLRFIARLQCDWWLPYRSIVRRLYEADAISLSTCEKLLKLDERKTDSIYYRIGETTSPEVFQLLNKQTKRLGTKSVNLEDCLRNYEDDIISEEELYDGLQLFERKPEDFGISFVDDEDDMTEMGGDSDAEG